MSPSPQHATHRVSVRAATRADAPAVGELLRGAKLPLEGVPEDLVNFLVAEDAGRLLGAIGLEPYGAAALLRSAVVAPEAQGAGVGESLVRALLASARASGVRTVVLLTTTAEEWFPRFGFARTTRDAVPAAVKVSAEFTGACPDSAVVMQLSLDTA